MHLTLGDIRKAVGNTAFSRGQEYAESDRVLLVEQSEDMIEGQVVGSGRNIYTQEIDVAVNGRQLHIEGDCSCPVGYNCKHVAAVLIEYLRAHAPVDTAVPEPAAGKSAPQKPAQPLSFAASSWLQRLESAVAAAIPKSDAESAKPKKGTAYRLVFVLAPTHNGKHATLSICKARLRVDGTIASADQVRDLHRLLSNPPAYLQPGDEDLIQFFGAMQGSVYYYDPYTEPRGKMGAQLLRALLDENKLLWANSLPDLTRGLVHTLHAAPARKASLAWREVNNSLQLAWQFQPSPEQGSTAVNLIDYVLPTNPPWYVDNLACGELSLQLDGATVSAPTLLALAAQTPPLDPRDAVAVSQQLLARGLDQIIPMPVQLEEVVLPDVPIEINLILGSVNAGPADNPDWQDYAMLVFFYDGQKVTIDGSTTEPKPIMRQSLNGVEKILRNQQAERQAYEQLRGFGFEPAVDKPGMRMAQGSLVLPNLSAWLQFGKEGLPALEQQGWKIRKMSAYRFNVVEVEDWYAEINEEAGNAWFDLELGIVVNQTRVSLLPMLVELIRSAPQDFNPEVLARHGDDDQLLATLPGGVRVALPWGRIKPILSTLGELYFNEKSGDSMRLSTLDAARLAELAGSTQLRWLGGERLRNMGKKLSEFGGVQKVAPPKGLQARLRDYQGEGLAWMQFLREYDLAGILADDMGLGKTIQTLAHILIEKEAGRLTQPALVVAPTTLMGNWQDEAARFAPDLRVLVLQGADRLGHFDEIEQFDLVLTTYALLPRDEEKLREHAFHLLILDEAHYIKNARSKAAQTAGLLRARHRLCLTGTPLENHLGELWSQFHFLLPGLLGDEKTFNTEFRIPIEKHGKDMRRALLARRIKPFLLRRTKDKVAKELPAKTEMVRTVELAGAQRDLYETVRLAMDKKVRDEIAKKGVARSQIVILEALLKLRQVCCDPRLVKSGTAKKAAAPSAKLDELTEMVEELLEEGRKILIFSQFTSMLALIEDELKERGIAYALLTGDTKDRAAVVRSFQQGEVPLFLISLKAGGVGLNLTAADTVIHYDPWWNPAAENQATDRAWRIGQDKPVFVYKLIAKGTLEEKIQALQQKKADLANAMLSDGAAQNVKITQEDLQGIFAPLED